MGSVRLRGVSGLIYQCVASSNFDCPSSPRFRFYRLSPFCLWHSLSIDVSLPINNLPLPITVCDNRSDNFDVTMWDRCTYHCACHYQLAILTVPVI